MRETGGTASKLRLCWPRWWHGGCGSLSRRGAERP